MLQMGKESREENNHMISGDFMAKRKRGRPRKHLKLDSNNEQSLGLPPPPGFSRSQQTRQRDDGESIVGQPVSGVIEATFEAGFLLSVKVGNSDSMLRGVVFKPGRCDPVSVNNDIAPGIPMVRRNSEVMHHHGSAKVGRKSRFREKRGGNSDKSRALVPVPIQPAPPTLLKNHFVPVVLQHPVVNLQNGGGHITVNHGPSLKKCQQQQLSAMQTETGSGASNGKPFETLLTQVMKKGQVHQPMEAESDEQALSIEPLQAIHPVHPVHMPKPMPSYGRGNMTQLLQENVRETQFSQGQ